MVFGSAIEGFGEPPGQEGASRGKQLILTQHGTSVGSQLAKARQVHRWHFQDRCGGTETGFELQLYHETRPSHFPSLSLNFHICRWGSVSPQRTLGEPSVERASAEHGPSKCPHLFSFSSPCDLSLGWAQQWGFSGVSTTSKPRDAGEWAISHPLP